jgi:hypothetical protein
MPKAMVVLFLRLDMSVDVRVPEQGLVTVTPEELLLSHVLVFVLSWPFFITQMGKVLSVFSVVQFNFDNWNSSQQDSWKGNEVNGLLPSVGDTFGVVDFFFVGLLEGFTSFGVIFG